MNQEYYAEDVNYWKTSRTGSDEWLDRAKREITTLGGKILMDGYGSEAQTGRAAFMLMFEIGPDRFKFVWPVLPSKSGNENAARIQAATMLYHSVKSRCVEAKALGVRNAFFNALMLPDGRAMSELPPDDVLELPRMFSGPILIDGKRGTNE